MLFRSLKNKRILVTAGPTIEFIDPIRVISNQSSGKTGILLCSELVSSGAKVTLIYGPGSEKPPTGIKTIKIKTSKEMLDAVKNEMKRKFDIVIMAAAVADYTPEFPTKNKLKSTKSLLEVSFKKTPKIIDQIKKYQSNVFLVGFKSEVGISKKMLVKEARKKMLESIKFVDEVVFFDSREELINSVKKYQPDIMVVGDDYRDQPVYGSEHAKELVFFEKLPEYSSTKILNYYKK